MPQSVNEALRDTLLTHSIGTDRLTAHQVNEILKLLQEAEREILYQLGRRARRFEIFGEDTGPDTTRYLMAAVDEIRWILERHSPALYGHLEAELAEIGVYEGEFIRSRLAGAIPRNVLPFVSIYSVRPDVLAAMVQSSPFQGHLLKTYFGTGPFSFSAAVQKQLTKKIRRSIAVGIAPAKIVSDLKATGIYLPRRYLSAITRTATQHVLNTAADNVFQANAGEDGVVKGVQWLSTLDMRTTLQWCVPRDHALYHPITHKGLDARGKQFPWLQGPGRIHWKCRSKSTTVTKSWKELGIKAREIQRRDRASMDGQVSRRIRADRWMRNQLKDPARYRQLQDLYGKRRIQAWRDGEITLARMISGDGRMLTLRDLGLLEGR